MILPNAPHLPDGTLVEVTPLNDKPSVGSAAAILAVMERLPKVPREWVDELEQVIAAGQRLPSPPVVFPDETESEVNG